ncbi:glycosyltransferase family 4 protein [Arsenicicoccus sp. oral taxon 190]|uniref:glycosyltransferase family 4 protein n=1 Tax=Arsenicicoccus sp. oral taxon 190 TaxID=1658671 RepID=UPI000679F168|nr:glycosyltransferase family 4 protein [Arsenicicoccus sp. oral taxon 190]AKT50759.1 group 1 glycosyl transferase [Arsenicicoccus sp. oral taxon 190]
MRIAFLSWRDLTHPEGGGAERYAQNVCAGLAVRGHDITFLCAAHGDAPAEEHLDGYRILRQGGRAGVYPAAVRRLRALEREEGHVDVVVDIQNGLPFGSRLGTLSPVVVLVHHVHKEQWPVVFHRAVADLGWWLESRVAPWLYRGCQYVSVSERTRDELVELGVAADDVSVIHNGTDVPWSTRSSRTPHPSLVVLGRLVPHKRVELAIDAVQALRHRFPGLRLRVVGDGWWREQVVEHAQRVGAADVVDILGFVDEVTKHRELASAWVSLAPSLKEGWGLNVIEAATHGAPTVAFHGAGGLSESVVDGHTGLLADDLPGFVAAVARLLEDHDLRHRMALAAEEHAARFSWEDTVTSWERLLARTAAHQPPVAVTDQVVTAPTGEPSRVSA